MSRSRLCIGNNIYMVLTWFTVVSCTLASTDQQVPFPTIWIHSTDQVQKVGDTVHLQCAFRSPNNKNDYSVYWIKKKNGNPERSLIISAGSTLFIPDDRFSPRMNYTSSHYTLQIKNAQQNDSGTYTCTLRTSTNDIVEQDIELKVVGGRFLIPETPPHPVIPFQDNLNFSVVFEGQNVSASDILNETNVTIQTMQLQLYKEKTKMSLKFLKQVIPLFQTIQKNMTQLLKSTPDDASSSYATYKRSEDKLDKELTLVEKQMEKNRMELQKYSTTYKKVERQLKVVHETLGRILLNSDE